MASREEFAPSYVLLDRTVRIDREAVRKESDWAIMECTDWKAYGCDGSCNRNDVENASRMKGLVLLARLAEPPNLSEISVRLAPAVPKAKQPTSFPPGTALLPIFDLPEGPENLPTHVEAAGDGLIVLNSRFADGSRYYLVYDAISKSLSMVAGLPDPCRTYCSMRPLPVRGSAGYSLRSRVGTYTYTLALVAKDWEFNMETGEYDYRNVLCLWSPRPFSIPSPCTIRSSYYDTPWQFKNALFPSEMPGSFHADKVFSSGGMCFWADLAQGPLFCRCEDVLSDGNDVQFFHIQLPPECRLDLMFHLRGDLELCRTMSCEGDSIKFVCVSAEPRTGHPGDSTVTMWTLSLATEQWLKDGELQVASLWEMEGFKNARLPRSIPVCPILIPNEDDGVLSFMLNEAGDELYMVTINMHSKRFLSAITLSPCPDDEVVPPLGFDLSKHIQDLSLHPIRDEGCPIATKRKLSSLN
ncbi:uncharacterized protein LOC102701624 [Oryza brachyantha]|uniref:DUF1618 domain-containing protein n=1 Tax=Oryza brachyantha TaxID=4533 RepID=J3LNU3_ORYBR|nr:uncharacterized protein LOC102701624 [Oryza brachyantha]XP_015690283.1 uncharacterized protein LOC102701624 [Oryza brachyantha]